jgi:hypothetical protein
MLTLVTLRNETTLRQLVERIYGTLDAKDRSNAEAQLLKANPHLAGKEAFRPGALVRVPPVRDLKPRPEAANSQDPVSGTLGTVATSVAEYRTRLASRLDAAAADLDAQGELLKDREVAVALKRTGATDLAKQLSEGLRARGKTLAEERKRHEALFKSIGDDIERLDHR